MYAVIFAVVWVKSLFVCVRACVLDLYVSGIVICFCRCTTFFLLLELLVLRGYKYNKDQGIIFEKSSNNFFFFFSIYKMDGHRDSENKIIYLYTILSPFEISYKKF